MSVVRVVQKNLVFAVGLSQRLADVEMLKKHDYFGKFGKIVKVVINQTTSYAGSQVRTAMFTACSHPTSLHGLMKRRTHSCIVHIRIHDLRQLHITLYHSTKEEMLL